MKTFAEYFQDSIDMTDGSVTMTEKDYEAIQTDAYNSAIHDAAATTNSGMDNYQRIMGLLK